MIKRSYYILPIKATRGQKVSRALEVLSNVSHFTQGEKEELLKLITNKKTK